MIVSLPQIFRQYLKFFSHDHDHIVICNNSLISIILSEQVLVKIKSPEYLKFEYFKSKAVNFLAVNIFLFKT